VSGFAFVVNLLDRLHGGFHTFDRGPVRLRRRHFETYFLKDVVGVITVSRPQNTEISLAGRLDAAFQLLNKVTGCRDTGGILEDLKARIITLHTSYKRSLNLEDQAQPAILRT
jgi:hypothetical protein